MRFRFRAKTGKEWKLKVSDRRIARIVRSCQELPGQHLFQYEDDNREVRAVSSADVNAYLREISGIDVTAKDFRTWAGTVMASIALNQIEPFTSDRIAKRNVKAAVAVVAEQLGNTAAICRKCYVHPKVIDTYMDGTLAKLLKRRSRKKLPQLRTEEKAALTLLAA